LGIVSCLLVSMSNLLQYCLDIPVIIRIPEIRLRVVQLIDNLRESISKLADSIGLVPRLEVCEKAGDNGIGASEENRRCARSSIVEGAQCRQTCRDEDLNEQ
jgi:hypothetical protein